MRRSIAVLGCIISMMACSSSAATEAVDLSADSGVYALLSMNSQPLPFTLLNSATSAILVTSDSLTLKADGTYRDVAHYQRMTNGVTDAPVIASGGTWTLSGRIAVFKADDGSSQSGTLDGSQLIFSGAGLITQVYKK